MFFLRGGTDAEIKILSFFSQGHSYMSRIFTRTLAHQSIHQHSPTPTAKSHRSDFFLATFIPPISPVIGDAVAPGTSDRSPSKGQQSPAGEHPAGFSTKILIVFLAKRQGGVLMPVTCLCVPTVFPLFSYVMQASNGVLLKGAKEGGVGGGYRVTRGSSAVQTKPFAGGKRKQQLFHFLNCKLFQTWVYYLLRLWRNVGTLSRFRSTIPRCWAISFSEQRRLKLRIGRWARRWAEPATSPADPRVVARPRAIPGTTQAVIAFQLLVLFYLLNLQNLCESDH